MVLVTVASANNGHQQDELAIALAMDVRHRGWTAFNALMTLPQSSTWLPCIIVCFAFSLFASVIVTKTNFIESEFALPSELRKAMLILRTLIAPAAVEEAFWRAFLLPAPEKLKGDVLAHMPVILFVSAVYVMSHVWPMANILSCLPGKAWRPGAMVTFRDWRFLVVVVLLAATEVLLYYMSCGSLFFCILVHWLTVAVWLFCMQGDEVLARPVEYEASPPPIWLLQFLCDLSLIAGSLSLTIGYVLLWINDGTRGIPSVFDLMVVPSSASWMQTSCVLVAMLMFVARLGCTQRLDKKTTWRLHLAGCISAIALSISALAPACVEFTGWERLYLFIEDPICGVRVGCVCTFFISAIIDMWVLHLYGTPPRLPPVDELRCAGRCFGCICVVGHHVPDVDACRRMLRFFASIALVVLSLLRASQIPANTWCGLSEWIFFLAFLFHTWTLRFDVCAAEAAGFNAPGNGSADDSDAL